MQIRRVTIENIRCFSRLELDFTDANGEVRKWTTLLGENGLGKSTLLQAIGATLAGEEATRELVPVVRTWFRHRTNEAKIVSEIKLPGRVPLKDELTLHVSFVPKFDPPPDENSPMEMIFSYGYVGRGDGRDSSDQWLNELSGLHYGDTTTLAVGYGPFRRLSGGSIEADRIAASGRRSARMITLFREDAALGSVRNWVIELHNTAREGDARNAARLRHVRAALVAGLLPKPAELLTTANSARLKFGAREPMEFDELSDGYRSMLALGLDLLRWLTWTFPDAEEPMKQPGVVLIDELDAHLHPTWQRTIGFWLRAQFPELQFIVATHSPFLAQVADPGGNIVLVEGEDGEITARQDNESVAAWQIDQVLTTLFGLSDTRAPEVEEKLARHEALYQRSLGETLSAEEAAEMEALTAWRESLSAPLEDPVQRRLSDLLRRSVDRLSERISELE